MLNFCTLFNSNYLSRGLAMYNSLLLHSKGFTLYIFTFDDKSYEILSKLNLKNVVLITLKDFEDSELLRIKPTRSPGEYCWTCTSSTILYCLNNFKLDHCTYIDSDLLFYNDPSVLINEMGTNSVLITEHRYSSDYKHYEEPNGKYCVQFVTFKNTVEGLKALNWWREACIEWCYARQEDGKFGDQKYLDDWTTRFKEIHELQYPGGGVAPWNVQQYNLKKSRDGLKIQEKSTGKIFDLIFYHFHAVKFYKNNKVDFLNYELSASVIKILYADYIRKLLEVKQQVAKLDNSFDPNGASAVNNEAEKNFGMEFQLFIKTAGQTLRSCITEVYHIVTLKKLKKITDRYHIYSISNIKNK